MKYPFLTIIIILLCVSAESFSQRLDFFTSQTGNAMITGSEDKVPYEETAGFFDYIPEGASADSVIDGQPVYFIYFKIPFEVHEIGIRLISPVPPYAFAEAGDEVTEAYETNKKSTGYFNPLITLESGIADDKDIRAGEIKSWEPLGKNDDSLELMAQPNGKRTNSLLRVYQGPYPAGIYRIKFSGVKNETTTGSYLMQLGTIPGIKRIKMSRKMFYD